MRFHFVKSSLNRAVGISIVLLLGASLALAQQQVNLSAGASSLVMPDGNSVPMWGYSCGTAVPSSLASCGALGKGAWSPVIITVPSGQDLQINLTNNLSFAGGKIPTSIVIVGQLGGGLGDLAERKTAPSPTHTPGTLTWPAAGAAGDPTFVPRPQGARVQSFSTEVAAGATTSLKWLAPRPGTYLLESGTHPSIQGPMGLYGIVVVTQAPANGAAGVAYPAAGASPVVNYNSEVPLLFSEIDPVQNNEVSTAVNTAGFSETQVWTRTGSGGPVTAINVTNGGSGYLVPPIVTITGSGSTAAATANLTGGVVTSINVTNGGEGYTTTGTTVSITPAQNDPGTGAAATATVILGGCGGGAHTCYPPAVNYTPLYYLVNGQAFDKTNASNSLFAASPASGVTGNVLVRLVN